jgi:hypothetical protein
MQVQVRSACVGVEPKFQLLESESNVGQLLEFRSAADLPSCNTGTGTSLALAIQFGFVADLIATAQLA